MEMITRVLFTCIYAKYSFDVYQTSQHVGLEHPSPNRMKQSDTSTTMIQQQTNFEISRKNKNKKSKWKENHKK